MQVSLSGPFFFIYLISLLASLPPFLSELLDIATYLMPKLVSAAENTAVTHAQATLHDAVLLLRFTKVPEAAQHTLIEWYHGLRPFVLLDHVPMPSEV